MELFHVRTEYSRISEAIPFKRSYLLKKLIACLIKAINLGRSGDRTLGAKLIRMAEQMAENPNTVNRNLTLEVKRRIRLEGIELENYRAKKRADEREAARQRLH